MHPTAADGLHPGTAWHVAVADFFPQLPNRNR